ncbi:extracellular solute-binding protein [Paenibacillus sp. HB172176]|uniref:extracellular solute-binding protein n=1 Tax=Paenibacillus sp. HB172176 TaxID=2493690 RepID=UPI00143B1EB7|nr:extracellular solute-binding protein [Paenibacillus sp. HB172176]
MRKKWMLSIALIAALAAGSIGCSNSNERENVPANTAGNQITPTGDGSQSGKENETKEPIKVSMMLPLFVAEAPSGDGEYVKKLEEVTDSELDLNWVPNTNYDDKVNVSLASGDLPKAMVVTNTKLPSVVSAVRSGAFWEIGPYLKDYPNLSALPEIGWVNTAIDGKQYGIYRYRDSVRDGIIYRKDWLDTLGLKEPTTTDELYSMLKAFAKDDPDRNGKDDTYGLVERSNMYSFKILAALFGAPVRWEVQDGAFTPWFKTQGYKDALDFYKKMYDEGILNPDFATLKNANETLFSGKAGSTFVTIDGAPNFTNETKKLNPAAEFDVMQGLANSDVAKVSTFPGHNGFVMFPKSSVKTEQELRDMLTFFDRLGSEEAITLFSWGIEGVDYTSAGGVKTATDKALTDEQRSLDQILVYSKEVRAATPLEEKVNRLIKEDSVKLGYNDPTSPLISQTQSEKGSELDKLISDASIKYIMGEMNAEQFQAEVDKWTAQGGAQIEKEYAEEYAKTAAK